jgi:hypothetical protein
MLYQWGIDVWDRLTMPPSFLDGFSDNHSSTSTYAGALIYDLDNIDDS